MVIVVAVGWHTCDTSYNTQRNYDLDWCWRVKCDPSCRQLVCLYLSIIKDGPSVSLNLGPQLLPQLSNKWRQQGRQKTDNKWREDLLTLFHSRKWRIAWCAYEHRGWSVRQQDKPAGFRQPQRTADTPVVDIYWGSLKQCDQNSVGSLNLSSHVWHVLNRNTLSCSTSLCCRFIGALVWNTVGKQAQISNIHLPIRD